MRQLFVLLIASALGSLFSAQAWAQNWGRFRGENGTGVSELKGIPATWKDADYAWKIELPHGGHSSPIIWEKTMFVTSATEGGGERFVHCLDADSGKEHWQRSSCIKVRSIRRTVGHPVRLARMAIESTFYSQMMRACWSWRGISLVEKRGAVNSADTTANTDLGRRRFSTKAC